MIYDAWVLKEKLSKDYAAPKNKIQQLKKNGEFVRIVKGLYETDAQVFPPSLAVSIYGPSYISFEYALSFWQMIPEKVSEYTSATLGKHRSKYFKTPLGNFSYSDVPEKVFPYDVLLQNMAGRQYLLASKEKALCDLLYKKKPVKNLSEMKALLFDDLRIDEEIFSQLEKETLQFICPLYAKSNLNFLLKLVLKETRR